MPSHNTPQLTLFGLGSCDTCRKAKKWLASRQQPFRFHDLRSDGLDAGRINLWLKSDFVSQLVNRQSTTWRQLSEVEKIAAASSPATVLLNHPALIKRPVFVLGEKIVAVGFKPQELERVLLA